MDEAVAELVNKKDQPHGLYTEGVNYRIGVRRWAEILEENRRRLHSYRDNLHSEGRTRQSLRTCSASAYLHKRTHETKEVRAAIEEENPKE